MVLRPRERENRIREIRTVLLKASRADTPTGALRLIKEAAAQLVLLIQLETTEGEDSETETDPGRAARAETTR